MIRFLVVTVLAALAVSSPASAAEFGTKAEAVAMVKRVQAQFRVNWFPDKCCMESTAAPA